ncbi:MAG: ferredoxin-NADP reductase [Planctomycetes bacterium]|nr:ferredoxin-NADP reductase [Planctomycetota bacterium]
MLLQDYDTTIQFTATVVTTERITPAATEEVREIQLDIDKKGFTASAGQSIGVLAPGQREFGQKHHFRLYTIADMPEHKGAVTRVKLCVKRCNYVDEYSGESYPGVASNYLCSLKPGDKILMTGPYGLAFPVPDEAGANLILIGAGTGIAPFRAFIRHLNAVKPAFTGKVRLFHGARSGLDLLYKNQQKNDLTLYYDHPTFVAIEALGKRPHWSDDIDWDGAVQSRGAEIGKLLDDSKTYVYVAGLEKVRDQLDKVFAEVVGTPARWARRKAELVAGKRWLELLY